MKLFDKMEISNALRYAISELVKESHVAGLFSKALDYSYIFEILAHDESLVHPALNTFEYKEEQVLISAYVHSLTSWQPNSDVEIGVIIFRRGVGSEEA